MGVFIKSVNVNAVLWEAFLTNWSSNRGSVISSLITTAVFKQSESHYTGCGDRIVHQAALTENGSAALRLKAQCGKMSIHDIDPCISIQAQFRTSPDIIRKYPWLLEIFKGGEQLEKWELRRIRGQHDWDGCVKSRSPGETLVLFSRAVASSRASICVTRWHCVTVGQIHTVLGGCELHRTTCNSCKWCI